MTGPEGTGVDLDRLRGWMDGEGLGSGPLADPHALAGGTQNVLLRFDRAGRSYLLRRPPLHKRANSDETMRREMRVLATLSGTDVPHPGLIAGCPDPEVLGAAFYLMEPVDGYNPTVEPPPDDPAWLHRMGLAMAEGIAALSRVDVTGLADFGRTEGWLERQTGRWRRQLDSYAELDGYVCELDGVDEVADWLDRHRPAAWTPGLIHGDFHFANVLFARDRPELAAIVDWELATLGDPLLDLGHLLAAWPGGGPDALSDQPWAPGLPTVGELVQHYAAASGRDVRDLRWYRVLACYRLGIILEGSHARAGAGLAPRAVGDRLHAATLALLRQARSLVRHGDSPQATEG